MSLFEKIVAGKEKISVVGLGYVGMPIAVAFARKVPVIGFDLNAKKIDLYKAGIDPTNEVGGEVIARSSVDFTSDETRLREAKFHIVAVPTPVNDDHTPDLTCVKSASTILGRNLTRDSVVVFESTVYPGVTEDICAPILEKESGLTCGVEFKIGYSPERINPGDKVHIYKGAALKNWIVYYPVEKIMARFTDVLITINKEDYERVKKFKAESVEYIPGVGADTSRFKPCGEEEAMDLKRELGYPENQSILLCIGELNKNKNQEAVIKALSEVIKIVPNTKLLLAGNGPNYKTLMQLADDLGLQKHIDFLGYRTKIEKYISISDVVISASIREGLPMNIVEALLCKQPVVASYNRGHKELVEHGVNGYLVNPNSYKEFSEYILKIIKEKAFDFTYTNDVWLNVKKFADKNVINELAKIYSRFQRGAEY